MGQLAALMHRLGDAGAIAPVVADEAIRAGVDYFARAFESDEPARLLGAALEEREARRRSRSVKR
jgi:hypothetical protein